MPETAASNVPDLRHEICNLLQVIDGYLELAAGRIDDETALRYLAHVHAAAHQLTELCRQSPSASPGDEQP